MRMNLLFDLIKRQFYNEFHCRKNFNVCLIECERKKKYDVKEYYCKKKKKISCRLHNFIIL